ncbi:MAG: leucine-rich repeat domain-containing protein, partial [Clostridia bacterium]|nr:leucine-rich repeat domain-containing protein [Clostridia bacterium]
MRKRVLSLVLVLLMVLSFFSVMPLSVSAATEYKSSYYTYILSDNQATITDVGVEISGSVVIPSSLNGYAVIAIGSNAFDDCDSLTSVALPSTVKTIGYHAFFACDMLTTITLGNNVTEIGEAAFANCTRLKSIEIPNSVTKM